MVEAQPRELAGKAQHLYQASRRAGHESRHERAIGVPGLSGTGYGDGPLLNSPPRWSLALRLAGTTVVTMRKDDRAVRLALVITVAMLETDTRCSVWTSVRAKTEQCCGLRTYCTPDSDWRRSRGTHRLITVTLHRSSWHGCRTHFVCSAFVPKRHPLAGACPIVAATMRTVFVQPNATSAGEQRERAPESFGHRRGRVAILLGEAKEDVLGYLAVPRALDADPVGWPAGATQLRVGQADG
jgi:mutator family transposase